MTEQENRFQTIIEIEEEPALYRVLATHYDGHVMCYDHANSNVAMAKVIEFIETHNREGTLKSEAKDWTFQTVKVDNPDELPTI